MTEKDRAVALELLGDSELVDQLAGRLDDANRTLADAVTYSVTTNDQRPTTNDGQPPTADGGHADDEPMVYELEPEALEQIADQVAQHRTVQGRYEQVTQLVEQRVNEVLTRLEQLSSDLEQRATQLTERLGRLEQDDQSRYREYDASKPKQPVVKLGVRPRERQANGVPDVKQESKFAARARERRAKA